METLDDGPCILCTMYVPSAFPSYKSKEENTQNSNTKIKYCCLNVYIHVLSSHGVVLKFVSV